MHPCVAPRALRALAALVVATGCGAVAPAPIPVANVAAVEEGETDAHWADDFLPDRTEGAVEHREWGRHVALIYAGRVYASNGDDMPAQILAPVFALAFAEPAADPPRVALIGVGSGVELAVLLHIGATVDVYEGRPELLRNVHHLTSRVGWTVDGLKITDRGLAHPRLRIVTSRLAAPPRPPTYHVILHANAVSVFSGGPPLFQVERFERLRDRLSPGGVLGIHQQLYDVRPDVHRRMVATFAAAFPEAISTVSEDLSSHSFLYGARHPLRIDAARTRELHVATAELRATERRDPWPNPIDLAARVLLRSRSEILTFSEGEAPYRAGRPMTENRWFRRLPQPDDSDDDEEAWKRWESANGAALAEMGISPAYLATIYQPDAWHGFPCDGGQCPLLRGFDGTGLARLARRQVAHGQLSRASETLRAAEARDGDPAAIEHVVALVRLFLGDEPPPTDLAALLGLSPTDPQALALREAMSVSHRSDFPGPRVNELIGELRARGAILDPVGERMVELIATLSEEAPALELADALSAETAFIQTHPEVRWWLARAYWNELLYDRAVDWAERHLRVTR